MELVRNILRTLSVVLQPLVGPVPPPDIASVAERPHINVLLCSISHRTGQGASTWATARYRILTRGLHSANFCRGVCTHQRTGSSEPKTEIAHLNSD
jgi:hypothetical protein